MEVILPAETERPAREPPAGGDSLAGRSVATPAKFAVLFVCSWAPDEPIAAVLEAAELLAGTDPDISITITGRPKLAATGWVGDLPRNVELPGYLSDHEFERRLAGCSVILDLTTRADCMVCGAYEAVSVGVPMILSNNEPTVRYFRKGALYTDNSAQDIARLILEARGRHTQLRQEVIELKDELATAEKVALEGLFKLVSDGGSR
jgi:glycosyltransferase involved in cell wall biosynthesis